MARLLLFLKRFFTKMKLMSLRTLLTIFIFVGFVTLFILLLPQNVYISEKQFRNFKVWSPDPKQTTYLMLTENYSMRKQSIFLIETSGASVITGRQCCAIESAARHHPNTTVYLLTRINTIKLEQPFLSLLSLPNVQVHHINYKKYFLDTPLEGLYRSGALARSNWPVSHMSDALRFLTLWKFGGTYLDLDTVMLRSLNNLTSCAGLESEKWVAAGVLKMDFGSPVIRACLWELARNFKGDDWGHNGPKLITRVLMEFCNKTDWKNPPVNCGGVQILPREAFYAVYYEDWPKLFSEVDWEKTLEKFASSYVFHTWQGLSGGSVVHVGSRQPYARMALTHCPNTYFNAGKTF